jgi:hypothetical protein
MIATEMLTNSNVNQAVVTLPAIGIDHVYWDDLVANNGLQHGLEADFRVSTVT